MKFKYNASQRLVLIIEAPGLSNCHPAIVARAIYYTSRSFGLPEPEDAMDQLRIRAKAQMSLRCKNR